MNDYIIEVDELKALQNTQPLVVLDTRDPDDYEETHLPNAIHLYDIFTYLCTRGNGGLPAMVAHFTRILSKIGLKPTDTVVVYEDAMDNGYGRSCRGWTILKYLGVEKVYVLHGGLRAWLKAGYPTTQEVPETESVPFTPILGADHIITAEEVVAAIDNPDIQIVDCRDYAEWIGANSSPYGYDYCPRKGRIPNAKWLEWYRMMKIRDGIPWFKSPQEILEVCDSAGITPEKPVYLYCFKGARTSNMYIALKLAGFPVVKNYFGSWNEWSRDFSLPIEEGYPKI
ncbi:MAG: sulfurtransferase [Anaerolineae bacterium]|nr:MAG: sulfurtransferase [Anaerolineae bacterium]